jgi:hypothetical protein
MGIFDSTTKRRNRPSGGGGNGSLELEDVRDEVPDVGDTLDEIDQVLAETDPQRAVLLRERSWLGDCGCFG